MAAIDPLENTVFSELPSDWRSLLYNTVNKDVLQVISDKIKKAYNTQTVFPASLDLFNAFEYTRLDDLKCVLLGQDPYHGLGQAHGLAFSIVQPTAIPPSLRNMLIELKSDLGIDAMASNKSDLTPWAKQGVLLLNTILTVIENQPNSHKNFGWEKLTKPLLLKLASLNRGIVFILLGNSAQKFFPELQALGASCIVAPHPSPLSAYRGFFGSSIFSKTNQKLAENNLRPIDWNL